MYKVAKSALLDVLIVRIMLWVVMCVLHWFYLSFHLGCSVQGQCTSFSIFNSSCTVVDSAVVSAPKITHHGEQIHCRPPVALTSLPKIAMQRIVVCIHVSSVLQFDLASGSSICCMASCLIWRSLRACSLISPVLSAQSNNLCWKKWWFGQTPNSQNCHLQNSIIAGSKTTCLNTSETKVLVLDQMLPSKKSLCTDRHWDLELVGFPNIKLD